MDYLDSGNLKLRNANQAANLKGLFTPINSNLLTINLDFEMDQIQYISM